MAFVTGGAGMFVGRSADFVAKTMRGEKVEYNDIPIVRRFVGGENFYAAPAKYREMRDLVATVGIAYKANIGDATARGSLRERFGPEVRMIPILATIQKRLTFLYKRRRIVTDRAGDNQVEIDKINDRIRVVMRKAVIRYGKLVEN